MNAFDQHIILNDGRKLGFAEYGNPHGFPILYCHGSQSSRLEMHYDLSFAVENDLRIITVDRPGHGLSDFNPNGSVLGFADDVQRLTEHLDIEQFSAAGMSAGAPFALGIARALPKRVEKVAIISGFAPYTAASRAHLSKDVKVMLRLAGSAPFLLTLMLKLQARQIANNPKKVLAGFLKSMSAPDQKVLAHGPVMDIFEKMFVEAFRNGSDGVAYEISRLLVNDWNFELADIRVPVSLWQGGQDKNVPAAWAEFMTREIPDATLTTYPDEGHLIIFQHATEIFAGLKPST